MKKNKKINAIITICLCLVLGGLFFIGQAPQEVKALGDNGGPDYLVCTVKNNVDSSTFTVNIPYLGSFYDIDEYEYNLNNLSKPNKTGYTYSSLTHNGMPTYINQSPLAANILYFAFRNSDVKPSPTIILNYTKNSYTVQYKYKMEGSATIENSYATNKTVMYGDRNTYNPDIGALLREGAYGLEITRWSPAINSVITNNTIFVATIRTIKYTIIWDANGGKF